MLDLKVMTDPAIDLFQSRDKSELLGAEEPYDLREILSESSLDPIDLACLSEQELAETLTGQGFEASLIHASSLIGEIKDALRT